MDLILVQKSYDKPYGNKNRKKDQTLYSKHVYINIYIYTIQACQFSVRYSVLRPDMQERGDINLASF